MTDLRRRFRDADGLSTPDLWDEAVRRASEPEAFRPAPALPRRGQVAAALVALTLFGGGAILAARAFLGTEPIPTRPRTTDPWSAIPAGWTELAPPPFERSDPAAVWTGRELILWGGGTDYNANFFADGAIYDPVSDEWAAMSDGPLRARADARAVWTGSEVLIWGGYGNQGRFSDGAAYRPETDTWRSFRPPLSNSPAHVWTGRELIVVGEQVTFVLAQDDPMGRATADDPAKDEARRAAAAYDPATDEWRWTAPPPLVFTDATAVWSGTEVIVYGSELNDRNISANRSAQGMAYNPATDSWRVLPEREISPQASWANWTGTEMLVWDYETNSALYEPASESWREPNPMPIEFSECYPYSVRTTTSVFAWFCGQMASFDIESDSWEPVDQGPVETFPNDPQSLGLPVGAGDVVVMLLRTDARCCELDEMWAYRAG